MRQRREKETEKEKERMQRRATTLEMRRKCDTDRCSVSSAKLNESPTQVDDTKEIDEM